MNKIFLSFCALLMSIGVYAQLQVNPQVGMNVMQFSNDEDEVEFNGNIGYSLGLDLRFGDKLQLQPGAHWFHASTATKVEGEEVQIDEDIVHQYIKLKALLAYNLIDRNSFKLRVNAGPSYDFLVNAELGDEDVTNEFNNGVFYLQGGVGVDILFLTADVGYAQGISDTYDGSEVFGDGKAAGFYFTVGVVFGN